MRWIVACCWVAGCGAGADDGPASEAEAESSAGDPSEGDASEGDESGDPVPIMCGASASGDACGLAVVPRGDARCLPYPLACPAAPTAAAVPVHMISSCTGAGCEPVGVPGCPMIGETTRSVGAASIETESEIAIALTFVGEPDGGTRIDWEAREVSLVEPHETIGEVRSGELALAGACCHTELELHFPHADLDVRTVIESDWMEVACDAATSDGFAYDPCFPEPGLPPPCGADRICLFEQGAPTGIGWDVCSSPCTADADCPAGPGGAPSRCREIEDGLPACVLDCADGQPCPEGMGCEADACVWRHECSGYDCTTLPPF